MKTQQVTTYGGADATVFSINHQLYLGVANAVSQALPYRVDSVIYKLAAVP